MPIEPMGPVVVGVDGSPAGSAALELALAEANARTSPVVVVHAVEEGETAESGARVTTLALSRARSTCPEVSSSAVVGAGDPDALLLARSRGSSLLVVGHNSGCAQGRVRRESIAHRVIGRAGVPVILHRRVEATGSPHRPVLVAVGGEPGDDVLLEFAFTEAAMWGAPLLAITVWPGTAHRDRDPSRRRFAEGRDAADRALADALRIWSEKYPEVPVRRAVRHGLDVPMAVTAASRSARLVVVGTAVRAGQRSSLSLAQILTHRAGCPVAVIPTR
ncbi:universal stress protein [Asanoa sp. NPDC049518]|uniref:universal stress protein n=1 Tax=unclassified Asanoa TaxID=2685164 RepID=UPI00344522F8